MRRAPSGEARHRDDSRRALVAHGQTHAADTERHAHR